MLVKFDFLQRYEPVSVIADNYQQNIVPMVMNMMKTRSWHLPKLGLSFHDKNVK